MKKLVLLLAAMAVGAAGLPAISAAADDLLAGVPPPVNSTKLGGGTVHSGGQQASYSTAEPPGSVIADYQKSLSAGGWAVIGSGGSGGGYGGGAGLQAKNGDKYLVVEAGGPAGRTFVHVCVWPTQPKDENCGD